MRLPQAGWHAGKTHARQNCVPSREHDRCAAHENSMVSAPKDLRAPRGVYGQLHPPPLGAVPWGGVVVWYPWPRKAGARARYSREGCAG
jgi:hypothetical protein